MSETKPFFDQRVIDVINAYVKSNTDPESIVTHHLPPEDLHTKIDIALHEKGCSVDDLYRALDLYLTFSVRTSSKVLHTFMPVRKPLRSEQ